MECPRCRVLLQTESYECVEVDRCPKCKGVWLDSGELRPILDRREKIFSPAEIKAVDGVERQTIVEDKSDEDGPPCPRCGRTMNEYNYGYDSGILVDRCKEHGVWFDAAELEHVQVVYEEGLKRLEDDKKAYGAVLCKVELEVAERLEKAEARDNKARFTLFRGLVSGLFDFWG